jgi:hypothetical protein
VLPDDTTAEVLYYGAGTADSGYPHGDKAFAETHGFSKVVYFDVAQRAWKDGQPIPADEYERDANVITCQHPR